MKDMNHTIFINFMLFCWLFYNFEGGFVESLDLDEGSSCIIEDIPKGDNGEKGTCVTIDRCEGGRELVTSGNPVKICSHSGPEPIICCPNSTLVDSPSTVPSQADDETLVYKIGDKAKQKCHDYSTLPRLTTGLCLPAEEKRRRKRNEEFIPIKKILPMPMPADITEYEDKYVPAIGGYPTSRKEYPHMALLGYGPDLESAKWHCSGAVISENYILTAAHCISDPDLGPVRFVALGLLNRTDPEEFWHRYGVKRIIPHPLYQSPTKYHDIALLETDKVINFTEAVLPACLDLGDTELKATTLIVSATGWGALGKNKELADILQKVYLKMFDKEECASQYPEHRHMKNGYDHKTQMCFGDKETVRNTCTGDSGGPLQVQFYDSETEKPQCQYEIIGVTSFGLKCHVLGNAGIYTRVRYYVPWIESVVWP